MKQHCISTVWKHISKGVLHFTHIQQSTVLETEYYTTVINLSKQLCYFYMIV